MLLLLGINVTWIIFEWHFQFRFIREALEHYTPAFFHFYNDNFHENFLKYDVYFITIFIIELLIRWVIAIVNKTHHRWFFFPFIHWYDVLGCIPVGTFRILRVLRVFSTMFRLQQMGVLDFRGSYFYRLGTKYYNILVEEVSDRVVVNVLSGMQEEVKGGNQLTNRMLTEIVKPHREKLVEWLSHRIKRTAMHNYGMYKEDIRDYLQQTVKNAVRTNKEVKDISQIPVLGSTIRKSLETAVSDITFNVIDNAIRDLASDHNNKAIEELTDIAFDIALLEEEDKELNKVITDMAVESIEMIKEQVKVQQWKIKEEKEKAG